MFAAGSDLPYVQEQVGHHDPSTTLKIYAQAIRRPDRDQLKAEMQALIAGTALKTARDKAPKGAKSLHEEKRARTRTPKPAA